MAIPGIIMVYIFQLFHQVTCKCCGSIFPFKLIIIHSRTQEQQKDKIKTKDKFEGQHIYFNTRATYSGLVFGQALQMFTQIELQFGNLYSCQSVKT